VSERRHDGGQLRLGEEDGDEETCRFGGASLDKMMGGPVCPCSYRMLIAS
jgi:hypothetical protein